MFFFFLFLLQKNQRIVIDGLSSGCLPPKVTSVYCLSVSGNMQVCSGWMSIIYCATSRRSVGTVKTLSQGANFTSLIEMPETGDQSKPTTIRFVTSLMERKT